MTLQSLLQVRTNRDGVVSRRSFLRNVAAGAAGLGVLGWKDAVTLAADDLRKQGLGCILLFMGGGPSQFETFDPKPGTTNGGPTKAIPTAVEMAVPAWPTLNRSKGDSRGSGKPDMPPRCRSLGRRCCRPVKSLCG